MNSCSSRWVLNKNVLERDRGGSGAGERWGDREREGGGNREARGGRGASEEPRGAVEWGRMGGQRGQAPPQAGPRPRRNFDDMPTTRPGNSNSTFR